MLKPLVALPSKSHSQPNAQYSSKSTKFLLDSTHTVLDVQDAAALSPYVGILKMLPF